MKKDSESESEEIRGENAGERFRIKVCMKQFFSDERAYAYVCVRERHRVRWLQRRLRTLFALPPRFVLLSRGHLLPPDESLAVLERDDTVDVIPARGEDAANQQATAESNDFSSHKMITAPDSGIGDSDTTTPIRIKKNATISGTGSIESKDDVDASVQPYDDEELQERKRRALAMLEQYCGEPEVSSHVARPRRRRVRRRRRVAPQSDAVEDFTPTLEDCNSARSSSPDCNGPEPARASSVLRNGCQKSRAPRVIRALGDDMS